ncbi:hypothetical protein [Lederbergia lenta]|uniref:hypothetical protein n=1 Tax=Lederbergia lenta TaxID=1467 RepID=UPI00203FC323|nr:hypothetical protein [Lederbergia lenta]MCM3109935.1 hypothetical protein [Lederbergia lenta]
MLKANIIMMDETILKEVMLFKDRNMGDSQILTKKEAERYLNSESKGSVYFGGKYVQGWLIPKRIMEYTLIEDSENFEKRVTEFVGKNNTIFDTNDTAAYIIEYRDELLKLLK